MSAYTTEYPDMSFPLTITPSMSVVHCGIGSKATSFGCCCTLEYPSATSPAQMRPNRIRTVKSVKRRHEEHFRVPMVNTPPSAIPTLLRERRNVITFGSSGNSVKI